MTHYTINNLGYHVEERGTGNPIVLLHGFTGSTETWRPLMSELEKGFRVIAIDLPGHGQTEAPPNIDRYRMEAVADGIAGLLEQLDAVPAHWLGYSMGGRIALYFACRFPLFVRSLLLESASPGILDTDDRVARAKQDFELAQRIEQEGVTHFVDYWQNLPLFDTQQRLSEETRTALRTQRLRNSATGLANSLRGMSTGVQPELWSELSNLGMPVQLIAGKDDRKFVDINRRMAAKIPNSRLMVIPNSGHAVHLEAAGLYSDLVLDFFSDASKHGGQHLPNAKKGNEYERGD